jgi:hypothetical protein
MTFWNYIKSVHTNDTPESCKKFWGAFGYFISGITVVILSLKGTTEPLLFYIITSAALLGLATAQTIMEAKYKQNDKA